MQASPPLSSSRGPTAFRFPVVRSAKAGIVVWGAGILPVLAALALLARAWWLQNFQALWIFGLLAGTSLLCSTWALRQWQRTPYGQLAWDGTGWHWLDAQSHGTPVRVAIAWDVQNFLLLRSQTLAASRLSMALGRSFNQDMRVPAWIWLERDMAVPQWGELRRALYFQNQQEHTAI